MHDIEPFFKWRDLYVASDDQRSPFYERTYSEFEFSQKVYNYYIHPQWDSFGSQTLYMKLLFVDYEIGYCIMELIGEWNDCLYNDIMYLKRDIIEVLQKEGINTFILLCEQVLNFHASEDDYYAEWYEEVSENSGWICCLNMHPHVMSEFEAIGLQYYLHFGPNYNDVIWQNKKPHQVKYMIEQIQQQSTKQLRY